MSNETPSPSSHDRHAPPPEDAGAFWSAPAALAPSPALLERVGRITAAPRHDCVLLGPSGAGKTSLMWALSRSAAVGGELGLVLGPGLSELSGKAPFPAGCAGPQRPPTEDRTSYDLQLRIPPDPGSRSGSDGLATFAVAVQDWPGGWLFPQATAGAAEASGPGETGAARAESFAAAARDAACLVLCVDAARRTDLWQKHLPALLNRLVVPAEDRFAPSLASLGRRPDLPPIQVPEMQLPFARVLVLLTRFDRLWVEIERALAAGNGAGAGALAALLRHLAGTAGAMARHLDPVRLAEERLGRNLLGQIQAALRPDARLAVGLTATAALADAVITPNGDHRIGPAVAAPWSGTGPPFGVVEAFQFVADGRISSPVELVATGRSVAERESEIGLEVPW